MSQPGDDAQRDMERRALRNVRGLLDKMEDQDRLDARAVKQLAFLGGVIVVLFAIFVAIWMHSRNTEPATNAVVIPVAPKAAAK